VLCMRYEELQFFHSTVASTFSAFGRNPSNLPAGAATTMTTVSLLSATGYMGEATVSKLSVTPPDSRQTSENTLNANVG
jgi:hypothetical protein